jgi:hypothetical protein
MLSKDHIEYLKSACLSYLVTKNMQAEFLCHVIQTKRLDSLNSVISEWFLDFYHVK